MNSKKLSIILVASLLASGCAMFDSLKLKRTPDAIVKETKLPANWQAPLPHGGKVEKLGEFWTQFDDALLIELIQSAQSVSSDMAAAKTRIAQARAARINQASLSRPSLDAAASASRSKQQPDISGDTGGPGNAGGGVGNVGFGSGASTSAQIGLQSAWELDLFNLNPALVASAQKTEDAAKASWHEARVAVAAELASSYFSHRLCNTQLAVFAKDLASRQETARLTAIAIKAGFTPKASQYLTAASVDDAKQQVNAQQAQCDANIKELVALTNMNEPQLREKLAQKAFMVEAMAAKNLFQINEIPAQVIAQRPDIARAEAEIIAAAASLQRNKATQLPRVSLNGSIGWMWLSGVGFSGNGTVWSLGPLSVTLPLYDSGKRKAEITSAEAAYDESAVNYRSKVRTAVKEVENALLTLHSTEARQQDLQKAIIGYQASFQATESKVKAGFANLLELEESRRLTLQTQTNLINVMLSRSNAWVSLYRAAGGDWRGLANEVNSKGSQ
jgi:outer membrane protein, multidrug efflux system